LASEHYWDVFHTWSGYGAPVLDPISHEPLAVLGIAGHEVVGYPHTLLTVAMAARAIEQRIKQMQIIKDQQIIGEGSRQAAGRLNDGLLAIDQRGRVLQMNAAASHLLRVPETTRTLDACPHLNEVVSSFLHRTILPVSPEEYQIYYPQTDHYLTTTIAPVVRDKCVIGVIVLLSHPQERSGTSLHRNPTETLARRGNSKWVRAKYSFEHILGGVAEVKQALRLAKLAATNTLSVLIAGESGTGKEMVAQAIHNASQRAHMPFIVVNCGAIPEELIEAEFFGYEAGAFTGARRGGSAGKFESADGGTIFLDEVTELSPSGQVALLRVLQEMEIVRLGSHLPTVIDVRVIAATNRDLRHEVETRRFRADLYYRLNVLSIELPPLRERRDDIPHLTDSILQSVAIQLGQQRFALSPEALNVLMAYDWPGNIRELKNVLERAAALSEGLILGIENLPPTLTSRQKRNPLGHGETGWTATRAFHERELLLKILTECSGNVSEAARRLSVSRKTLQRKMKKYQVSSQKTIS
jgi:transcriptional regulator with PAS, ATPase and Fis domain